jgi:hypothetical protein
MGVKHTIRTAVIIWSLKCRENRTTKNCFASCTKIQPFCSHAEVAIPPPFELRPVDCAFPQDVDGSKLLQFLAHRNHGSPSEKALFSGTPQKNVKSSDLHQGQKSVFDWFHAPVRRVKESFSFVGRSRRCRESRRSLRVQALTKQIVALAEGEISR